MRPIRLKVNGVRSYRQPTEVDFTDLSLFALLGDTGAGKSSLIEALCLALYSSTTWDAKNVLELMSDATNTMAVELTFEANGETWTVTRGYRRTSTPATHKLVSASGHKVDGARPVTKHIQELLGLSRDQFLRAVVMPQGQFEKLLRSTPKERTEILKGVFRLQSLGAVRDEVGKLLGRWRVPVGQLRGERNALPENPAAELEQAARDHDAATERSNVLSELVNSGAEAADRAKATQERIQGIDELVSALERELDGVTVEVVGKVIAAAAEIERQAAEASELRDTAERKALEAADRAEMALGGFLSRDVAVASVALFTTSSERIQQLDAAREATHQRLAELDSKPLATAVDLKLTAVSATAVAVSGQAQQALEGAQRAERAAREAFGRWDDGRERLGEAGHDEARAGENLEAAKEKVEQAAEDLRSCEEMASVADDAYDDAVRNNAAAAAATGCQVGDDCPVCAQPLPTGFEPPVAGDLKNLQQARDAATRNLARVRQEHTAALDAVSAATDRVNESKTAAKVATKALATAAKELKALLGYALADDLTEPDALAGPIAVVEERAGQAAAASSDVRRLSEEIVRAETALEAAQKQRASDQARHQGDLHRTEVELAEIRTRLRALPDRWRPAEDVSADGLLTASQAIGQALEAQATHSADVAHLNEKRQAAEQELLGLETTRERDVEQPLASLLTRATAAAVAVGRLRSAAESESEQPVVAPAGSQPTQVNAFVVTLRKTATDVTKQVAKVCAKLDKDLRSYEAAVTKSLKAAGATSLDEVREMAASERTNATHLKSAVDTATTKASRATTIDDALAVAEPFIANLEALDKLLLDSRFIGHLVRERERALLVEASRVLRRLSKDRFGFADNFRVIDRHSARERDPETLSGGERFQASLALALALVEIATRGGGQLEAVFIDEGFGSLDAASLDQALTTLGSVASGGKLVALVSHLRQVAEYVDQVLLVEHTDEHGSTVRRLDPTERDQLLAEDARSRMTA